MTDPALDQSASSRLLIEDAQQGSVSSHAQRTMDRYLQFVREQRAPVASMNYRPFPTSRKQQTVNKAPAHEGHKFDASAIAQLFDKLDDSASPDEEASAPTPASDSLAPPVPLTKPGGAAWTLDLSNWQKTSGGSLPSSAAGSKRGSMIGGASRKSSLNVGDSKLWAATTGRSAQRGFESSQQIWNMQGTVVGERAHRVDETLSREHPHGMKQESAFGMGMGKEEASGLDTESSSSSLSKKRGSLKQPQPFLRAHAAEQKLLEQAHSKRMVSSQGKRASMPPIHQHRGGFMGISPGNSRRGSLSLARSGPSAAALNASRARSQSLPTDSLFLAYSQCALPAVMTCSLASMPVPSQPAIPVAVARRYSVLATDGLTGGAQHTEAAKGSLTEDRRAASDSAMVYVNPENVDGIDTSSVLDTTQLHDLSSPIDNDEEAEQLAGACPQPARRGSISSSMRGLMSESVSRHSSPASSPMDMGDIPTYSFPMRMEAPVSMPASVSGLGFNHSGARSRSMIHTKSPALRLSPMPSGLSAHRSDGVASVGTPDFTPMTSPTNLSHAAFHSTLMNRRMSDVVARDIGKKLAVLKKHMAEEQGEMDGQQEEEGGLEMEGMQQFRAL